ncbi:hypothetical protein LINPERPRIM_LOCUS39814 [Linum perenne]
MVRKKNTTVEAMEKAVHKFQNNVKDLSKMRKVVQDLLALCFLAHIMINLLGFLLLGTQNLVVAYLSTPSSMISFGSSSPICKVSSNEIVVYKINWYNSEALQ